MIINIYSINLFVNYNMIGWLANKMVHCSCIIYQKIKLQIVMKKG